MLIDETCFYFSDDPTEEEHYLGYLPEYEKRTGRDIVISRMAANLKRQMNW